MKKILLAALLVSSVFLSGCLDTEGWRGKEDSTFFKGIDSALIPQQCAEHKEDVCALFSCMVSSCWCEESPDRILKQGSATISSEEEAIALVQAYVLETNSVYSQVENAAKLNNVFYNVFAYDSSGDEKVFTVAADGTIVKTFCGV